MSSSFLYHAVGVRGYQFVRTEYQGDRTIFTIRQDDKALPCLVCGFGDARPRAMVGRRPDWLSFSGCLPQWRAVAHASSIRHGSLLASS